MNDIKVFNNNEFGDIRIIVIDGKEYFYGVDVATALKYERPSKAVSDNCKGVLTKDTLKNKGGYPEKLISEGDVYRLIVKAADQSRSEDVKIAASKFETWIFDEVLPSIRKTGGYVNNDELFINTYLPFADQNTVLLFKTTLSTVREQNEIIKKQREEIEHKEDVIIGLVDNITLAGKRQVLNRVVRYNHANYRDRWSLLYREFEQKYHINLQQRLDTYNESHKPKLKNKIDYIDKIMNKIPELYEIAAKLFENDVKDLVKEMYETIS